MTYVIKPYSYKRAEELNVTIKPSNKKNKKIDVYKNNKYICSIGDDNYTDYPTLLLTDHKLARQRQILYHKRHKKYSNIIGSPSYYAYNILW